MDISIEAIESDLARAESTLGRPESAIHMQRAQVRATLLAVQPGLPTGWLIPFPAPDSWNEHIAAAAFVLGMGVDDLAARLDPMAGTEPAPKVVESVVEPEEDDIDADFDRLRKR